MAATLNTHCPTIQCAGCAEAIKRSLGKMAGVQRVDVDVAGKNVIVQYQESQVKSEDLRQRLEQAGFPPE